MSDWSELKRLAEEATPGRNFDRLPSAGGGLKYTCTGDDGSLVLRVDHKNDEFGFIGERGQEDEAFFLACTPAAILALIAENERLSRFEEAYKEWIDKTEWVQDSAAAKDLGKHRADVMNERINQLRAEVEKLREVINYASKSLATVTSSDGSGHADISLSVLRLAGVSAEERERLVEGWKSNAQWRIDSDMKREQSNA